MKIVSISDTHGYHDSIDMPNGDIVIHAGDCTPRGNVKDLVKFCMWYDRLPYKNKILIAGNHDFCFEHNKKLKGFNTSDEEYTAAEICKSFGITYLMDSSVTINGVKFYGSPWQPAFHGWAFNLTSAELKEVWKKIPEDTDVLITHGPPWGESDVCLNDGKNAGCNELRKRIEEVKPKYHFFGHIHEGYGITWNDNTEFINASICAFPQRPVNKPRVHVINKGA